MSEQTFLERAQLAWPGVSMDTLDELLWTVTRFPFGDVDRVMAELHMNYVNFEGNVQRAIDSMYADIGTALQQIEKDH